MSQYLIEGKGKGMIKDFLLHEVWFRHCRKNTIAVSDELCDCSMCHTLGCRHSSAALIYLAAFPHYKVLTLAFHVLHLVFVF